MSTSSRVSALVARLLSNHYSPSAGPLARAGRLQRTWPFTLAGAIGVLVLALPSTKVIDRTPLVWATVVALLLVLIAVATPWERLPVQAQAVVPLAFPLVVALVRDSTGGAGGVSVLLMLPVLWLALYGNGWQLFTSIVLTMAVFLIPILAIGAPQYPSSSVGVVALFPVTGAIVGVTTFRLVAAERARAAFVGSLLSAATQQSIIATDPDGRITVFNTGAERMTGYSAEQMVGTATALRLHDPDEVATRAAELGLPVGFEVLTAAARVGRPETREWSYLTRDGRRLQVSLSVTPVYDAGDELRGFVTVGTDVTEQRAAQRVRDEFVALVSHELRTPLASIIGYLEVLVDEDAGSLTSRQRQFLEVVERNARRQLRLVGDLLFVSQVDAGQMRLDVEDVDLVALARAAVEAAQPRADGAGVTVELHAGEPAVVRGDPDRLGQVLDNLLSNAIKFTPSGGRVDVSARVDGQTATLEVADTGFGIPVTEQEQLFTRFFRASTATQRAVPGIGLGLTIVRAIVEGHGGTVTARSGEGEGTLFSVELPACVQTPDRPVAGAGAHRPA